MKKAIINILLIISFIIVYLLQVNIFSGLKIAGVMPNLYIIYILFIGLFYGQIAGTTYGILVGIMLDLIVGRKVGVSAIMLGTVGILGGIFDKNFSKESRITLMIMVITSTIVYEIGAYIVGFFIYKYNLEIMSFSKILILECIYNILITIILHPILQNLGYKIEEEYKGNKILTRYF